MKTIINNWVEQTNFFGLDYSSAKAIVEDYEFDIRYDCDGTYDKVKPDNCELTLMITYKHKVMYSGFGNNIDELKNFCQKWLEKEILSYHKKYCVMLSESDLSVQKSVFIVFRKSDLVIQGCFNERAKAENWANQSVYLEIKELKIN